MYYLTTEIVSLKTTVAKIYEYQLFRKEYFYVCCNSGILA